MHIFYFIIRSHNFHHFLKQIIVINFFFFFHSQAYHRPKTAAVQVARIIAFTVVVVSIILGGFMLASSYVQANGYRQHELELQLLSEAADKIQPEALVQVYY